MFVVADFFVRVTVTYNMANYFTVFLEQYDHSASLCLTIAFESPYLDALFLSLLRSRGKFGVIGPLLCFSAVCVSLLLIFFSLSI